jgi:CheY-like chemotaxis protein
VGNENKEKYPHLFFSVLNKPVKQQQLNNHIQAALRSETASYPLEKEKSNQILPNDFANRYPLRILLADDNPVNQKLTNRILGKLGYEPAETAQNGIEVIEKFDDQFYDVILMDVQMPEMDGLEATRMIRSRQYQQPVIIAMTANVMQGDREACLLAGMDDYISKPVKLEILISVLEKWALKINDKNISVDANVLAADIQKGKSL